jgi:hypothetical protein
MVTLNKKINKWELFNLENVTDIQLKEMALYIMKENNSDETLLESDAIVSYEYKGDNDEYGSFGISLVLNEDKYDLVVFGELNGDIEYEEIFNIEKSGFALQKLYELLLQYKSPTMYFTNKK